MLSCFFRFQVNKENVPIFGCSFIPLNHPDKTIFFNVLKKTDFSNCIFKNTQNVRLDLDS
jgi:hypothetical protein